MNSKTDDKKLQEYCDKILQYQEMLFGATKDLAIRVKEASSITDNIDTKIKEVIIELTEQIKELRSEILLLRSISKNIPESVKEGIDEFVSKVGKEVQDIYQDRLQAIDKKIEENSVSLINIANNATTSIEKIREVGNNSLDALIIKSKKLGSNYFKQIGINMAILTIIATVVSVFTSYLTLQQFPTKVFVDNANNITIDKSNVNILKKVENKKSK